MKESTIDKLLLILSLTFFVMLFLIVVMTPNQHREVNTVIKVDTVSNKSDKALIYFLLHQRIVKNNAAKR